VVHIPQPGSVTCRTLVSVVATRNDPKTLNGSNGNDTLEGQEGADSLIGGAGNDVFNVTSTGNADQIAADTIVGGTGTNSFQIATGANAIAAEYDMDNVSDVLAFNTFGAGAGGINHTLTFSAITETTAQVVTINGSSVTTATSDMVIANNSARATTTFNITGGSGADTLQGGAGVDTLIGGAAADRLHGAGGVDVVTGGAGADTAVFLRTDTLTTDKNNVTDHVSTTDILEINTSSGAALAGSFTGMVDGNGTASAAIGNGASANADPSAAINIAAGAAVDVGAAGDDVLIFNAAVANGIDGLAAALAAAGTTIREQGSAQFANGDKMFAVVENSTPAVNQADVGIVTFNGAGVISGVTTIFEVDLVGGLTAAQVAADIDYTGLA
jgi:Ca2+-binding RTX toxin-like protein